MKKFMLLVSLGFFCIGAFGQMYRIIDGQYYRSDDPSVWRVFYHLEVRRVFANGTLTVQVFEDITTTSTTAVGPRAKTFGADGHTARRYEEILILKNFHSNMALSPGMDIGYVKAKLVGNAGPTDIYDMGVPYYPPAIQLTPQQKLQKQMLQESNTVVYWKSQATNGMPDEQCQLGEWYMTNSYARDTNSGFYWLSVSAGKGNTQAPDFIQQWATNTDLAQK